MIRASSSRRTLLALGLALLASPRPAAAQGQARFDVPVPDTAAAPPAAIAATGPATSDRIVYQVVPVVSGDRHSVTTTLSTVPVLASTGEPLLGSSLYLQLGRPDLAAAFEDRQSSRIALAVAGGAVALAGMVYSATRPGPDASLPFDQFKAAADAQSQGQMQGMVLSVGGLAVMAIAAFMDPNPVGEAERKRLVEEHNRGLASGGSVKETGSEGPRLSLGAELLPGGALARVGVSY